MNFGNKILKKFQKEIKENALEFLYIFSVSIGIELHNSY